MRALIMIIYSHKGWTLSFKDNIIIAAKKMETMKVIIKTYPKYE